MGSSTDGQPLGVDNRAVLLRSVVITANAMRSEFAEWDSPVGAEWFWVVMYWEVARLREGP